MLGIGTGERSAVFNLGIKAASHATLRAYVEAIRGLLTTGTATWQGKAASLTCGSQEHSDIHRRLRPAHFAARRGDR